MAFAAPINDPTSSLTLPEQTCQRLTLAEIKSATRNFDESLVIGRGGFGKVYKSVAKLGSVHKVAIKRVNSTSSQGACEFEAEVKLLSTLRHGNLVPLIGYCTEGEEMVLAYEFMPNGTLEDHLHRGATELSWLQRLKICVGAARGLDYLHTGTSTQHGVIHRDVKSSNILLDSNFEARISDFGLAKVGALNQTKTHVSTLVKGTFGYMDPYYFYSGKVTRKSDVYAFGVVLFEVLSGKQAVDPTLDESLADWAQERVKEGRLDKIVSHTLVGQISKKCLKEFTSIAVKCLHNQPKLRPTMAEIVVKLESILSREREIVGPSVGDGRFVSKVRYFFTGKTYLIQASVDGSKSNKPNIKTLTYIELKTATKVDYNEAKLCFYSLDTIYKGWVEESTYNPIESGVYIRTRHTETSQRLFKPKEYHHPNLVNLLGYCLYGRQLSCVYEQCPNASLDELLYGGKTSLSWVARLKIATGAADGLRFLHKKGHSAYSQFNTSCILDYNARLQDFLVENSFEDYGSYSFFKDTHHLPPEWSSYLSDKLDGFPNEIDPRQEGFLEKSEIYYFGVVLQEILTGIKGFDLNRRNSMPKLIKRATPLPRDIKYLRTIMDPQLMDNNNNLPKGVFMFAELVSKCLEPTQNGRPSMEEIFHVLSNVSSMQT